MLGPDAPKSGAVEFEYQTEKVGSPLMATYELGRSVPRNHLPFSSASCVAEEPTPRLPK
jgi:hypothetical protein